MIRTLPKAVLLTVALALSTPPARAADAAALAAALAAAKARLKADAVELRRGDGVAALAGLPAASLDLVLLDPPFDAAALADAALAAAARAVRPGGFVYLEAPRAWPGDRLAALGLAPHRHLKAGAVHAQLLARTAGASA